MLLMLFVGILLITPAHADAKQLKITSVTGNVMCVGQSGTIKANQKVTWHSLNKKLSIITKETGNKIKICAVKKGTGTIIAQTNTNTVSVRIKIKEKSDVKQNVISKPINETIIRKQYFIKSMSGDKIGLSQAVQGEVVAYATIEDTTMITGTDASTISKEDLQIGQYVMLEYGSIRESFPAFIIDCQSVTVLADSGEILLMVKHSDKESKILTLTVSNKTGADIFIGREFTLEKFEDGMWKAVEFREGTGFTEEAIAVRANGSAVLMVSLDSYFDDTRQGKYRISKQIYPGYVICAEFTLD